MLTLLHTTIAFFLPDHTRFSPSPRLTLFQQALVLSCPSRVLASPHPQPTPASAEGPTLGILLSNLLEEGEMYLSHLSVC